MSTSTSTIDNSNNLISLANLNTIETETTLVTPDMTILVEVLLESIPLPVYKLTAEEMFWIHNFIKTSPESFNTITIDILKITADGKIDVHDIPAIIKLFADVYHSDAIQVGLVDKKNIIAFIKFTLEVILESQLLVLPDIEKKAIEAIVNASLSLLWMNIDTMDAVQKKSHGCFANICPSWKKKQ